MTLSFFLTAARRRKLLVFYLTSQKVKRNSWRRKMSYRWIAKEGRNKAPQIQGVFTALGRRLKPFVHVALDLYGKPF
jgi:hypothetical protein